MILTLWEDDKEQNVAPGYQAFPVNSASGGLNAFLFHPACCASPRFQPPATLTIGNVKREGLFLQYLQPHWKQWVPGMLGRRLCWWECQLRFAGPKGSGGLSKPWIRTQAAGCSSEPTAKLSEVCLVLLGTRCKPILCLLEEELARLLLHTQQLWGYSFPLFSKILLLEHNFKRSILITCFHLLYSLFTSSGLSK